MNITKFLHGIYYGVYEKYVHFGVALLLFFLFLIFTTWQIAVVLVLTLSIGKELYDKYIRKTRFDLYDLGVDILGILSAILVYFITKRP